MRKKLRVTTYHTLSQRFWYQLEIGSESGCWNWLGGLTGRDGRCRFSVRGKCVYAYRYSYETYVGSIPDGLQVLHKCDNPRCVNPDHLFLGTISVNMKDAYAKGRKSNLGTKNPRAILTEDQVRDIRRRYKTVGGAKLAREYGVARNLPYNIVVGKIWRHVQ